MTATPELRLEIGHVLFIDIIGYSKLLITEQSELLRKLTDAVRETERFRSAEAEEKLVRLPTGDGMALVFRDSPEAPVECALELSKNLKAHPEVAVRMGIHSGPVNEVADVNERTNITGAGINMAQRVMDCGDAGHILLSKRVADDLEQYPRWRSQLHELGECEVKHGVRVRLFNLFGDGFGNPEAPARLHSAKLREGNRATARKSIAVLPFENLSEDKANAYFADGIQEEILTRLSRISDLKVISRTSTQRFKNTAEQIPEIAKLLGVATILEGSVRKAGDNVRVHVQLIDAENDAHLWAERYDRKLDDIFAVETDIATKIADALQAELTRAERRAIASRPTKNTAAHELYLKGRYLWRNFYAPGYERVREYFEQAIALDAAYAPAYNGLSLYYSFAAANAIFSPNESWPLAEELVRKSLKLDDTLAEAYNALAAVELYYKRNWPAAERAFLRGMQLDPNFGDIPAHYGLCLSYFGRNDEALAQMERAAQLDPFFPGVNLHQGVVFFFLRDYDRAATQFTKTLELYPGYAAAHEYLGEVCAKKEMPSEAITQWCAALRLNGQAEEARVLEQVFSTTGFDAAVRRLGQRQLEALDSKRAHGEYVPAAHYLFAQIRRGNIEEAFACLPEVLEERDWFALQLRVNPMVDPLRADPRFEKLVASPAPKP